MIFFLLPAGNPPYQHRRRRPYRLRGILPLRGILLLGGRLERQRFDGANAGVEREARGAAADETEGAHGQGGEDRKVGLRRDVQGWSKKGRDRGCMMCITISKKS